MKVQNSEHNSVMELKIPTTTYVKLVAMIIGTVLILAALRRTSHALILLFAAFFLAIALNAPVSFMARHMPGKARGSRAVGTTIAFLIVVLFLGGFIASIAPPLVRQTENFINAAPHLIKNVRSQDSAVGKTVRRYHLEKQVDSFSSQLSNRIKSNSGRAFTTLQKIGSSIFSMVTILALTFMMLVEGPRRLKFLSELLPERTQPLVQRMSQDMYRVIKGYVNGQVSLALLAALLISPALFILHISYPVALIVLIFICGLIPLVGHTIGAVLVTGVALGSSFTNAIIILIYYIFYQQVENYLIQPRIQANSTDMSPLLVFGSVVIGVSFGGPFGGLVAIPVAGCLRVGALEYLRSRYNVDDRRPAIKKEVKEAIGETK